MVIIEYRKFSEYDYEYCQNKNTRSTSILIPKILRVYFRVFFPDKYKFVYANDNIIYRTNTSLIV